jgi:hypothetical protein
VSAPKFWLVTIVKRSEALVMAATGRDAVRIISGALETDGEDVGDPVADPLEAEDAHEVVGERLLRDHGNAIPYGTNDDRTVREILTETPEEVAAREEKERWRAGHKATADLFPGVAS